MSETTPIDQSITTAINQALKMRIDEILNETVEEARKTVSRRIRDEVAQIVLKTQHFYDVEKFTDRLVITVKADLPGEEDQS